MNRFTSQTLGSTV